MRGAILCAGVSVLTATSSCALARAAYEKPLSLNGDNGPFAYSEQLIADDFSLATDTAIVNATWYGNYLGTGDPFDTGQKVDFTVRLYADTGAGPASSAFFARNITAVITDTGLSQAGDSIYLFTASFDPVNVSGLKTYHFGVEEIDSGTGKPSFRWNNGADVAGDDDLSYHSSDHGQTWSGESGARSAMAFALNVPAPGSLLAAASAALLGSRRRR